MDQPLSPVPAQLGANDRGSGLLWLCCAEGDRLRLLKRLRAAGASQAGRPKIMRSIYYDTDRRKLLHSGYRLCVRTQQGKRFQDVEMTAGATLAPGICSTTELEGEAPGKASLQDTPLKGILGGRAAGKLKPVFSVDVRRRASILDRDGSGIVASFDMGTIGGDGVAQRVCELKLELVSGTRDVLFDLARELASAVPLTLTLRSPGERGFRLLPARAGHPGGDPPAEIHAAMTARDAADYICRSSAAALLDSLAQLSSGGGQDALHRTRIGLRRLRALLWFLKPILGAEVAVLSSRLRSLAQSLGRARELDVLCDRPLAPLRRDHPGAPGVDTLYEVFDRRRQEAHETVMAFMRSPAMLDFSLDLVGGLAALWASEPSQPRHRQWREKPVAAFAQARLHSRLKAFLKQSRDLQHCAVGRQHDIRVKAKKLRYAVEAFHPTIGAKRSRRLTAGLVHLQDLLGELNDARTGHAIMLAYARETAGAADDRAPTLFAAGLAAAACAPDATAMLDQAAQARDGLAALARP